MPKTLDAPKAERHEVTKQEAEATYKELRDALRAAIGLRKPWTAADVEAMLPTAAGALDQGVREGEISEDAALELLKILVATLYEYRMSEQVDSALQGVRFSGSRPSFQGLAYYDRRSSSEG